MFGNIKKTSEKSIYYPLLASEDLDNGGNSVEEIQNIWSRLQALPTERKNILLSDELPEKLKKFQETFGCDDASVEATSVLIRWFFFDEVDQAGFQGGLQDIFGEQAQKVHDFIQEEILTIKPKPKVEEAGEAEEKSQAVTVKMPLLQALSKYEQLGNQLISRERIKIKSQSEPVRPSLLYWIKYYRDELGIGHHDSVQRGNFLFRSENGKRLSAEERERVNLVLKSVEENFPLEIDTERSEIIFPAFQASTAVRSPQTQGMSPQAPVFQSSRPASPANPAFVFGQGGMASNVPALAVPASAPQGGEMSFSSKHVFPAEKAPQTAQAPQAAPAPAPRATEAPTPRMNQPTTVNAPASAQTVPRTNPFRIRPVSLGKEE